MAYYWFERAVERTRKILLEKYKDAVMSVDIFDPKLGIFHINEKVTISTKYTVG